MAKHFMKTNHKGLRYFEHDTRKHGKKKDRYYSIRFRLDGKLHHFGVGWLSDGIPDAIRKEEPNIGFEDYCLKLLRQYKGNIKTGTGPKSPKEKRAIEQEKLYLAEQERKEEEKKNITFGQFMTDTYLPQSKLDKKAKSHEIESMLYERHMADIIGHLPFGNISAFHLEKIKKTMADKKLSARTIQYVLQTIRHAFKKAKDRKIFDGDSPTKTIKWPKPDNMKLRYLSIDEAETLLAALATKSQTLHDTALLSLNCGLRFGEIAALTWSCVNLEQGTLVILNAKTGSRTAYLTDRAKALLESRKKYLKQKKGKDELVFPKRSGKKGVMVQASKVFRDTVDELKLNEGITDRKQKVTFHTLRHSFATHLYESTHDLYLTQRSLGHATSTMTARYAKMSESRLREGAKALEKAFATKGTKQVEQVVNYKK
jgi:site-specific recombinase XerD